MCSLISQNGFIYCFPIMVIYDFGNIIVAGVTNFDGSSSENFAEQIFRLERFINWI